jgi:hypothetical protein
MAKEFAPEYMTALRRYHQNHPEHEAAAHRAVLGGLSPEVAAEIVRQGDPSVAYHSRVGQIGSLPKSQHAQAVAALRAGELSGAQRPGSAHKNDNERTDQYINSRPRLGRHERRTRLVR